jgi:hypothetical protein
VTPPFYAALSIASEGRKWDLPFGWRLTTFHSALLRRFLDRNGSGCAGFLFNAKLSTASLQATAASIN